MERVPFNALLIVDGDDTIVDCNSHLLRMLGYRNKEQLIGRPADQLLYLSTTIRKLRNRHNPGSEGSGKLPAITLRTREGNLLIADVVTLPFAVSGKQRYALFIHNAKLRGLSLLQQFSDTFMKDVNLGVLLINADFTLVDISDTACKVLGFRREDIVNRPVEDVFASVPIEHQLVQRTILDGAVVKDHAISWTNNQERYELLMDSNLLKDDEGMTVGAYVIFKDVSNLRSLEAQVQRSDRLAMIGQIAAGTAHEIRNPLTSIKGFLQMFKKTLRDKGLEKEYGYAEIMLTEIDRINELVSEFLLLSKPKNISYELINISTVLQEILPIIHNEAILHGVQVQYIRTLDVPEIVADRELLKQVFLNLCKNGIEAMTNGGTLTISEKIDAEDAQRVNINIRDTGPGIPPFVIDKIFDPFFTTKSNGTGLGLSVCQRIIHDIGGTIRVSSKGYGTTFTVSMPFRHANR